MTANINGVALQDANASGATYWNAWTHTALCYDNIDQKAYIFTNGVLRASGTVDWTTAHDFLHVFLGRSEYTADGYYVGRLRNFRISRGICRYTAAFANRRSPTISGPTPYDTICLPMNGEDECGNPIYWDGSTPVIVEDNKSYPAAVHNSALNFGNNRRFWFNNVGLGGRDFTIEAWAYMSSSTESYGRIFEWVNTGSTGNRLEFARNATNNYLYCTGITCNVFATNLTILNQKFHFAVVYEHDAQKLSLYINGILKGSLSAYNIPYQTRRLFLSGSGTSSANRFYGSIAEFRVSDIARWTENFPMYNSTFTKDTYTVALCHFTSSVTADDCGNVWNTVGTPAIINGELSLDGSSCLQLDGGIDIGGQDFTVEAWICVRQYTGYRRVWHIGNTLNKNDITLCNNNTAGTFWWSTNGSNIVTSANYWNQRVHVAQVYKHDEGKSYYYVNGVLVGTYNNTIARYHAQYVWLGRGAYSDAYLVGQIKEFRISDGIARYNKAFPLPAQDFPDGTAAARYTVDPNTKILVHGDNPRPFSGNTPATDWCGNVFKYGTDLTVTTDHAKFTNALYVRPHQTWLKTVTTAFNFTGQDFCVDFWAYTLTPAAYGSNVPAFFTLIDSIHKTPYPRFMLYMAAATTLKICTVNKANTEVGATATVTMINTLNHYAVTYSAGVAKVYVNGALKITLTTNFEVGSYYVTIGANPAGNTVTNYCNHFQGYISEFRISQNTTRWTDTFTPPTEAYTTDDNTWALLHFSSVTADACGNTTWEQFCIKPVFSTSVVPFPNASSVYFANGAKLYCEAFKLGGADFTIEGWAYMSSSTTKNGRILEMLETLGTNSSGIVLARNDTSNAIYLWAWGEGNTSGTSISFNHTMNAWFHWAIVQEYSAGTIKVYINGTLVGTHTRVLPRVSRHVLIGCSSWNTDGMFIGYMTDFHVTDGVAKYKKNFQPPLWPHYFRGDTTVSGTAPGATVGYSHAGVKDTYGSTTNSEVRHHDNFYDYMRYATQSGSGVAQKNVLTATKQKTGGLVTQKRGAKKYLADKTGVRARVPQILNTLFDYNGTAQFPILKDIDYDKVNVTNFVATAAGTYDLTLTLKNLGYLWNMGHKNPIIKQWKINSVLALDSTAPASIALNPSINRATFLVNDSGSAISVKTSNAAVATAEASGRTIIIWRKGTGSATITVTADSDGKSVTMPVTVSAIDDATVSYMKFNSNVTPWADLVTENTWTSTGIDTWYYGKIIANKTQAFDLTKDWEVSFTYQYVSGAAADWNEIFAWGPHYSWKRNDSHIGIFSAGGSYNNYSSNRTAIRTFKAVYDAAAGTLTRTIDGVDTVTNITYTQTSYSYFYIGGGGCQLIQTFYLKNLIIKAYLAGADTQSVGNYPFTNNSLTGTGDIAITTNSASLHTVPDSINSTNARQGTALQLTGPQYLLSNNTVPIADTDFTVEWWGYMSSATTQSGGFWMLSPSNDPSQRYTTANRIGFERIANTTNITIDVISSSSSSMYTDNLSYNCTGLILDQLNHYAFVYCKDNTTIYFYLNGILKFSRVCNIPEATRYMFLGTSSFAHGQFKGTIDEFRISNFARYNGNFTPLTTAYDLVGPSTIVTVPTNIDNYDTNTTVISTAKINSIDHHYACLKDTINCCWTDGTIAKKLVSRSVTDATGNIFNVVNSPTIQTNTAKFGSAITFGSSYLSKKTTFPLGGQDFTIDFWSYPTGYGSSKVFGLSASGVRIISFSYFNGKEGWRMYTTREAGGNIGCKAAVSTNTWHHIAMCYVAETHTAYLFVDGVLQGTNSNYTYARLDYSLHVGHEQFWGGYYAGTLDEFRISDGIARWTADFTPPTAQYSVDTNTVVLLHF